MGYYAGAVGQPQTPPHTPSSQVSFGSVDGEAEYVAPLREMADDQGADFDAVRGDEFEAGFLSAAAAAAGAGEDQSDPTGDITEMNPIQKQHNDFADVFDAVISKTVGTRLRRRDENAKLMAREGRSHPQTRLYSM